jgi:hypothetical protein
MELLLDLLVLWIKEVLCRRISVSSIAESLTLGDHYLLSSIFRRLMGYIVQ